MIIQKVIKGMGTRRSVQDVFRTGILSRWWESVNPLPANEVPFRLTERNLSWHQNRFQDPDPLQAMRPFCEMTPFISTTAGTVERDTFAHSNMLTPAWLSALSFATDLWTCDGYLFYCYVFIIGKRAIGHQGLAEELRELNIYTGFSPFQPEGEITAKIVIPPSQIERAEVWSMVKMRSDLSAGRIPTPDGEVLNSMYLPPEDYNNVREVLA